MYIDKLLEFSDAQAVTAEDAYVSAATQLASASERLASLRATLRGRMKDSALVNKMEFGAKFGAALRQCWRRWCDLL